MASSCKETELSNTLQEFCNTFKKCECDTTSCSNTNTFNYMYKLKRLSDININPIGKKKTHKSSNNPDLSIFKLIKQTKQTKQGTIPEAIEDYKSYITKVIGEVKCTLGKFKERMHRLELNNLKKVANKHDAEDILFIIGCIITKLKEELTKQEELLRMPKQLKKPDSNKPYIHEYGELHHNHDHKNNSLSQNDHVSIKSKPQENCEESLLIKNSSNSFLEVSAKIAAWKKRNRASFFNAAREIEVVQKKNFQNNLRTTNATVLATEHIIPEQRSTKSKNVSLRNKLISKKEKYIRSSDDDDVNSTYSTVSLFSTRNRNVLKRSQDNNRIICKNKKKLSDRLKSSFRYSRLLHLRKVSKSQLINLSSCNSDETIIIPENKKHKMSICNEQNASQNSAKCSNMDVLSVNSSISSTFSAYIVPSTSFDTKNGNSSQINPATTKNNETTIDKKMFMICKVVLDKL